jgi:hypothetical protein
MKFHIVVVTVLLSLGFLLQSVEGSIAQSNIEKFPLSKIWGKNVLEMSYWKTRGEGILCVAISHVDKSGPVSFTLGKLIFYRQFLFLKHFFHKIRCRP